MIKQVTCEVCLNSFEAKSICPFCNSRIEIPIDTDTEWAICYTTSDIVDATYIQAMLEGGNIPVQILSQIDTTRMFTIGELAIIKIMVPIPYIDEANELVKSIEDDNNSNLI